MAEVEICVDSLESCVAAASGGCSRLELCSALSEGGLTPSPAFLRAAKSLVSVPVFCMVRYRGGNMVFSEDEAKLMVDEAEDLVRAGADGIVFGAINATGEIDEGLCLRIRKVAGDLPCTFHRAFDLLPDPLQQMERVVALGYSRILTSGCQPSALQGAQTIRSLVEASAGRVGIMAGAGISSRNLAELMQATGVRMVHASAKVCRRDTNTGTVNMGAGDDATRWVADAAEVSRLVDIAQGVGRSS